MKNYRLVILVLLMLFIPYYLISAKPNSQIVLEKTTEKGDASVVKDIGIYFNIENYTTKSENFVFKNEEVVEAENNLSFSEGLDGDDALDPQIKAYKDEYKQFMRGKLATNLTNYYETDDTLFYVSTDERLNYYLSEEKPKLNLSVLKKETKEVKNHEFELKVKPDTYYNEVISFYESDHILTVLLESESNDSSELIAYKINAVTGELKSAEVIKSFDLSSDEKGIHKIIYMDVNRDRKEELIITEERYYAADEEEFLEDEPVEHELLDEERNLLYTYNAETNDFKEIKNPERFASVHTLTDKRLVLNSDKENKLTIYERETMKKLNEFSLVNNETEETIRASIDGLDYLVDSLENYETGEMTKIDLTVLDIEGAKEVYKASYQVQANLQNNEILSLDKIQ